MGLSRAETDKNDKIERVFGISKSHLSQTPHECANDSKNQLVFSRG